MELREASDLICRERGLSTIEKPGSTHTPRQLYLAEKNGEPTRYNIMRQDINMAIACSYDGREFLHNLRTLGYIVRDDPGRKYATIQMPGTSHPTRFKTLGEDYTEEAIQRRILQQDRYYYMGAPAAVHAVQRQQGQSPQPVPVLLLSYPVSEPARMRKEQRLYIYILT